MESPPFLPQTTRSSLFTSPFNTPFPRSAHYTGTKLPSPPRAHVAAVQVIYGCLTQEGEAAQVESEPVDSSL